MRISDDQICDTGGSWLMVIITYVPLTVKHKIKTPHHKAAVNLSTCKQKPGHVNTE